MFECSSAIATLMMRLLMLTLMIAAVWTGLARANAVPGLPGDRTALGMRAAVRMFDDCRHSDDGFGLCMKRKAVTLIDRFARVDSIALTDDVRLDRSTADAGAAAATAPAAVDIDWEANLPRSAEGRESAVNEVLLQRLAGALAGRTMTVQLPMLSSQDIGRGLEEGSLG